MEAEVNHIKNEIYYNPEEYSLPNVWTYQNSFTYENDDLKAIFAIV